MPRHADAPRDLLFGLLALHNGMVTRDQIVAAFGAWTASDRPMADLLVDQGALTAPRRALLDALAAEHLAAHGGDPEKSLAALDLNRSTRESLANAGGPQVGATLAHVGSGSGSNGDAERTSTYAVGITTSDGQRFRVLRPHARGGLGAVFVALDGELNREVALKQILPHHADDPVSRQRFLVEAEITGGLEHPGIVPVYGLGTYEGGRPYYAMRFIRGDSLKEAIERFHSDESLKRDLGRRSLELRKLLRRFLDVCNAIEYAHSRGVLHRDIKPGNVIVGKHGETLVVDWGLAKPLGKVEPGQDSGERVLIPCSASGAETLPGSALGTPPYMSPEQAAGDLDALGPQSDVYSLGASLYCLLTGRPPFDGEVGEVLRKVHRGEFPPPRRVDPSIDEALEAVCLKAMATRSENRYASCRALADDVERWTADEPVAAYAEPWTRTLLRWLTRHRTGVTGVAAAGLALMVGLAAVAVVQGQGRAKLEVAYGQVTRSNADLTRAKERISQANAELESANAKIRARYDLAAEAIRTFHTGVSEDVMLKEPHLAGLRAQLLGAALQFYRRLQAGLEEAREPGSGAALADAYAEVASISRLIGSGADSLEALRRALAIRESLASGPEVPPRNDAAIAALLLDLSRQTRGTDPDGAERAIARCTAILGRLLEVDPHDRESWDNLASCHGELGGLNWLRGDLAAALKGFGRTLEINERLLREHPDDERTRLHMAVTLLNIRNCQQGLGRTGDALASARRAVGILEELRRTHPGDTRFVGPGLGGTLDGYEWWALLDLARSQRLIGKPTEAIASAKRAVVAARRNADAFPAVPSYQACVAEAEREVGGSLLSAGKWAEAVAAFEAALARLDGLPSRTGEEWFETACCHAALAGLADRDGSGVSAAEAAGEADAAMALLRKAVVMGWRNPDIFRIETALDPLRSRHDFKLLMMDLAMPADPFAAAH